MNWPSRVRGTLTFALILERRSKTADGGGTFSAPQKVGGGGVLPLNRHRGPRLAFAGSAIVITAAISPYRSIRDEVRASMENFVEVYVNTPLEVCIRRDVKGMYKKALAGELKHFTGIDDPYEPPLNPELVIQTDKETPDASSGRILAGLEQMGLIERTSDITYSSEEESRIRTRLIALGYVHA